MWAGVSSTRRVPRDVNPSPAACRLCDPSELLSCFPPRIVRPTPSLGERRGSFHSGGTWYLVAVAWSPLHCPGRGPHRLCGLLCTRLGVCSAEPPCMSGSIVPSSSGPEPDPYPPAFKQAPCAQGVSQVLKVGEGPKPPSLPHH